MSSGRVANLVIAGVPKAGTGSLFAYLAQHPDICGSDEKETGYFNHYNPRRHTGPPPPIEDYARHFAHCSGERYALEATPTYSYGGQPVIEAIRAVLGEPKIIIIAARPGRSGSGRRTRSSARWARSPASTPSSSTSRSSRAGGGTSTTSCPATACPGSYIGFYADYLGDWFDEFGDDLRSRLRRGPPPRPPRGGRQGSAPGSASTPTSSPPSTSAPAMSPGIPRSTRLARPPTSVRRRADRLAVRVPPRRARALRRAYLRVNAGGDALRAVRARRSAATWRTSTGVQPGTARGCSPRTATGTCRPGSASVRRA